MITNLSKNCIIVPKSNSIFSEKAPNFSIFKENSVRKWHLTMLGKNILTTAMLQKKKCDFVLCAVRFKPKTKRSQYCSDTCRAMASKRKRGEAYTDVPPSTPLWKKGFGLTKLTKMARRQLLLHNPALLENLYTDELQLERLLEMLLEKEEQLAVEQAKMDQLTEVYKQKGKGLKSELPDSFAARSRQLANQTPAESKTTTDKLIGIAGEGVGTIIDMIEYQKWEQKEQVRQNELDKVDKEIKQVSLQVNGIKNEIAWIESKMEELHDELQTTIQALNHPPLISLPSSVYQTEKGISKPESSSEISDRMHDSFSTRRQLSGRELANVKFSESLRLKGSLGDFLGDLDREYLSITLTGNAGQGKTHMCFILAKYFCKLKLHVAFWSAEEGISKKVQDKVKYYKLSKGSRFNILEAGTLSDLHEDAEKYDVVIIDSWTVLGIKAEEFGKLTKAYPKTIFVAIFQQTTGKQIRGGNRPLYDSSINIEVREGVAYNLKNRCGGKGEYQIFDS